MIRERIADDIYIFTSRRYAHVTCGAILTNEGVILIDTLFYPDEAREVRDFIETRLGKKVRYVINTHYHADHISGTWLYPHATVVSHASCRDLIDTVGRRGLQLTKSKSKEFSHSTIVLPKLVMRQEEMDITIGKKTVRLIHLPGHSKDLIGVHLLEDNVLFASDTMMPLPTFFDGDFDQLQASLAKIDKLLPDTVVQGHGEVILRGEVSHVISSHLNYMNKIKDEIKLLIEKGMPRDHVDQISIESCGKSRIPLNGLVIDLHLANLYHLYDQFIMMRTTKFEQETNSLKSVKKQRI